VGGRKRITCRYIRPYTFNIDYGRPPISRLGPTLPDSARPGYFSARARADAPFLTTLEAIHTTYRIVLAVANRLTATASLGLYIKRLPRHLSACEWDCCERLSITVNHSAVLLIYSNDHNLSVFLSSWIMAINTGLGPEARACGPRPTCTRWFTKYTARPIRCTDSRLMAPPVFAEISTFRSGCTNLS